jgi:predicted GNAT superfamily acetyltransferase
LPTDRLHAEWWMQSERVEAILSGVPAAPLDIQQTILVPHAIGTWKSSTEDQAHALAVQTENRIRLQEAFARGLAIIDFRTDAEGNGIFGLGPWEEPTSPQR